VENPDSVLTLTHVEVVGNSAGIATSVNPGQSGGGVCTSGRLVLDHTTVGTTDDPNQPSGSGGGIWAGNGLTTRASMIQGNSAGVEGGGALVAAGGASITDGSAILDNRALNVHDYAGGISFHAGDVTVSRSRASTSSPAAAERSPVKLMTSAPWFMP
jgi:hypothetical protein